MCGKALATATHHLIFGSSLRRLADEDKIYIKICDDCHTMGKLNERVHDNVAAERLSKMLGQSLYENKVIASGLSPSEAREKFVERYGISYL